MLLAVDVGNSNTSLGVFEGEELKAEFRLGTHRGWTRDEVAIVMRQALALENLDFRGVTRAVVASVVPPVSGPVLDAIRKYAGVEALVVGPGIRTGMPIRYDPPQDVGADRIVSAVAAHHRYGRDADGEPRGIVVVDFGTATTFDVISPKPEYLGGVITPGVGIGADALFARAAKLPRVDIARPDRVVGRNTVAALQSGLVFGYIGLVEGTLARIRAEVDWPVAVIATGGFASTLAEEAAGIEAVHDDLMLQGLRLIYERNSRG
jgi:type III pantothenate kinase